MLPSQRGLERIGTLNRDRDAQSSHIDSSRNLVLNIAAVGNLSTDPNQLVNTLQNTLFRDAHRCLLSSRNLITSEYTDQCIKAIKNLVRIDFLVPFSIKRKCLAALHAAEFCRFPRAAPYRVFHLGNCKSSLRYITQRMRRESYGFHL